MPTCRQMMPGLGAEVLVRFEQIAIKCKVVDVKNAYGQTRVLIQPAAGDGTQWVELRRIVTPDHRASNLHVLT